MIYTPCECQPSAPGTPSDPNPCSDPSCFINTTFMYEIIEIIEDPFMPLKNSEGKDLLCIRIGNKLCFHPDRLKMVGDALASKDNTP